MTQPRYTPELQRFDELASAFGLDPLQENPA